jgi:tetratricopeptide (TPR) repeat protein
LLQAAEVARACGADDVLVRAAIATDRGFMRLGEFAPRQLQLVEWALAVVPDDDRRSRAHLLALLGQCLVHVGDHERRMVAALEALALTEGDDDLLARLGPGLQYALWSPDNAALRVELARRTIAAAVRVADPYLEFTAHSVAHNTAICVGDPLAAAASARRLRELADQFDSPRMRWMVRALDAFHLTMAARFDEAQVAVDETFALGSQMDEHDAFSIFASQYFVLGTFAGRHAELLEVVQLAGGAPGVKLPFRLAHAIIAAATGDEEIPRALLAERLDLGLDQIDPNLFWLTSIIGLAILTIELEDVASAQVLLPALLPFAAEVSFNGVTSQGPVAAYIGKLASLLGDHDLADVQLERAAEMAETFGWPYHRASTNVAQVEARLRRLGTFDAAASAALDAAEALCRELGIRTWSDKAAALRTRYAVAPPSP